MITVGYHLGIDYGTSNTAAVIHEAGCAARPLLFDGLPQLPSAVCVGPDGRGLLVGREAIHAARVRPERFEPHPKRRIDDGTVLLGDGEYPVAYLIAAVLAQVRAEAVRAMGGPPAAVALTYPAAWASRRRAVLTEAARLAELDIVGAGGTRRDQPGEAGREHGADRAEHDSDRAHHGSDRAASGRSAGGVAREHSMGVTEHERNVGRPAEDRGAGGPGRQESGHKHDVGGAGHERGAGGTGLEHYVGGAGHERGVSGAGREDGVGWPGQVDAAGGTEWGQAAGAGSWELAAERRLPELVPEPIAAASYFALSTGVEVPPASCVVVYDFGAGTFDASVVRRTATGWEVAASDGLPDAGGLDVDAAIVAYLGAVYSGAHPEQMHRLDRPESAGDRRASRNLWEDVRTAKEILSRSSSTYVHLPILEQDALLGREQVERLAGPVVARTVALTRAVIASSVPAGRLAGLFLVGGSSRMPLVATLLHRVTGVAPTVMEQPELAVAYGSVMPFGTATRPVRQRAAIRERAAVPGAVPVSEQTAALIGRELPAAEVAPPDRTLKLIVGSDTDADTVVEAGPATARADVATQRGETETDTQSWHGVEVRRPSEIDTQRIETNALGQLSVVGADAGVPTAAVADTRGRSDDGAENSGDSQRPAEANGLRAVADGLGDGRRGGGPLLVAVVLLAVLVAMVILSRATFTAWDFWLGDALLYPGFVLWLAYLFAAPGGRTQWRLACYAVVLVPGGLGAYRAAGALAAWRGTTAVLGALAGVVAISVVALVLRHTDDPNTTNGPNTTDYPDTTNGPNTTDYPDTTNDSNTTDPNTTDDPNAQRIEGPSTTRTEGPDARRADDPNAERNEESSAQRTDDPDTHRTGGGTASYAGGRGGKAVFGRADALGLLLGLAAFGAGHIPDFGADPSWELVLAGGPVAIAFVGLGAALGQYVAASEPAARRWLPRTAALVLTLGAAGMALHVTNTLFS